MRTAFLVFILSAGMCSAQSNDPNPATEKAAKIRAKTQRPAGAELIANGDFETLRSGIPVGWASKTNENLRVESEDGNHFLRLRATEPEQMISLYRAIPLCPDDRAFELTFRVRYEDIKPGEKMWFDGRIMMNFKDPEKKTIGGAPAPYFRGTHKDWRSVTNRFLVPAAATMLEIMPALFHAKSGTLDLDDLHLKPLSQEEADALIAAKAAAEKQKAERAAILEKDLAQPARVVELKVVSNQVVTVTGQPVWLQGLSVDSMQWGPGDNILWSIRVAIDEWHANVIRLPVHHDRWSGKATRSNPSDAEAYRRLVDQAVKLCASKGAYLVLDLHVFGAPMAVHAAFWKDAAARYQNNPAVLFELFNEPHGISWKLWRDGGNLKEDVHTDVNPVENTEKNDGEVSVGMQALVDAVRGTGAKNIVLVSGLDWSYDLGGFVNGYALDDKGGNGQMVVWHNYPWKRDWAAKGLVAAEKYPIILTEVGAIQKWEDFPFIPPGGRYPLEGWAEDMLGLIQKHKLHWTGFSFHPRCGPMIISDWDYTPTPYWGVYVKAALAGKEFELKKLR